MSKDKQRYCDHRECRDDAVDELLWMATNFPKRREELRRAAAMVDNLSVPVRCRKVPNKGRGVGVIADAPLP